MHSLARILLCIALSMLTTHLFCQSFSEYEIGALAPNTEAVAVWADLDNDGDSDLVLSSYTSPVSIYKNYGGYLAFHSNMNLPALLHPVMATADFNMDGFADLVLSGNIGSDDVPIAGGGIYLNDGTGNFAKSVEANLTHLFHGSVDCADFDLDGDTDILMTGSDKSIVVRTVILVNNGDGSFSDLPNELPGVRGIYGATASWGDYDRDGDFDILLSGDNFLRNQANRPLTKIFVNNGDRTFSESTVTLSQFNGKAEWVDLNVDGWLDVFVSGNIATEPARVYVNDAGSFHEAGSLDIEVPLQDFLWRDFDNDGDKDLLAIESREGGVSLFLNDEGVLVRSENVSFPYHSNISSADFEGDGDADILLGGYSVNSTPSIAAYANNTSQANAKPTAPVNLVAGVSERKVSFSWTASPDAETGITALEYVLRVGTSPGSSNVVSPLTTLTGNNLGGESINGYSKTQTSVSNLPSGIYYATVQSIDESGNVSLPSNSVSFSINAPAIGPEAPGDLGLSVTSTNFIQLSWIDRSSNEDEFIIERSQDGTSFQLLVTLPKNVMRYIDKSVMLGKEYQYKLKAQNGSGSSDYTEVKSILNPRGYFTKLDGFEPVINEANHSVSVNWVDYDNDGLQDLFMAAASMPNLLYRNEGDGGFQRIASGNLLTDKVQNRRSCWADYDNDGDMDVFIPTSFKGRLFENKNGDYIEVASPPFDSATPDTYGVSWVDYDNDGFLDLSVLYYQAASKLYHNNGNGTFNSVTDGIFSGDVAAFSSIAWCDYNNDGWQDALAVNYQGNLILYKNNNGKTFERVPGPITESSSGAVTASWGDYDNDGDFDAFIGHNANEGDGFFKNNGDGTFTRTSNAITQSNVQAVGSSWGDINNDGNLDLFVVSDDEKIIFFNQGDGSFQRYHQEPALSDAGYTQGVALGDYNRDGFLDAAIPTVYMDNVILKNNGNENHWISFRLRGTKTNRNAIGAKIAITTGGKMMTGYVASQTGHSSQNSFEVEFGLGSSASVDSVVVEWPNRGYQVLLDVPADQLFDVVEPEFPLAPLVTTARLGKDNLSIDWNDVGGASGYILERSIGNRHSFQRVSLRSAMQSGYIDQMPIELDSVFYRVLTLKDNNLSKYSKISAVFCLLHTPVEVTSHVEDNNILIGWTDKSNVEAQFEIFRSSDNVNFELSSKVPANNALYNDADYEEEASYYYTIRAIKESFASDYSDTVLIHTGLKAPTNIGFNLSDGYVLVTWTDNSQKETSYTIERSDGGNQNFTALGATTANVVEFADETVGFRTQSYYRIRAENASAESPYSDEALLVVTAAEHFPEGVIQIYPNPTRKILTVESRSGKKHLWVVNSLGIAVINTASSTERTVIDVTGLPEGVYLLTVKDAGTTHTKRFSVVR